LLAFAAAETAARVRSCATGPTLLAEALRTAREAWPELALADDVWLPYLAQRIPSGEQLERGLRNWHAVELYLCCACVTGSAPALTAFQRQHWTAVQTALSALKLGALADEVAQHLRQRLFLPDGDTPPMIAGYAGLGHLDAWLRVVATRVARRALAQDKRHMLVGDDFLAERIAADDAGAELLRAKPTYRRAFAKAFRAALAELQPRQVNLLKLRFADELGLERIAAIYRVHHTTVHRQLRALQDHLARRTRELLMRELEIGDEDCRSLIRLIQSDFGLTLRSFFSPAQAPSRR
jgi:RNA polymerase sigma-70 factor (ECF subfamily)